MINWSNQLGIGVRHFRGVLLVWGGGGGEGGDCSRTLG